MVKNSPVFITGASGFIGGQLAERLLREGRAVRVLARRPVPHLEKLGAVVVNGDLHDPGALYRGSEGAGTVFHVAGRVGVWGPPADFHRVNVEGTRRVIETCRALGVPRLVYTSSPSVVYHGGDLAGIDESAPLCTAAPCAYPTSKAAAEREVAAAHGDGLATVSLRPHLVWGPGDRNVVPRVLDLASRGRLKIVGSGRNRVDLTHVANVVDAHLLAEQALADPAGRAGGRAYFITNGEPVVLWDWINELLRGLRIPAIRKRASLPMAYLAGGLFELLWRVLPLPDEPPMTRFVAQELATDHWFDISAARRDLGYAPRVTMAAGTAELIEHFRETYGN
jgi:nucleoside-diphosphate-sugar epimerase